MAAQLDHLVYAVLDLDEAVAEFEALTGVRPAPGGVHPGRGTRNALVGLHWGGGNRTYLELLAPDPAQPDVPDEDLMLDLASARDRAPVLHTWAVRPDHLDTTIERARRAGLDVGNPVGASRELPDGRTLAWELAVPRPLGLRGLQPFLIDWTGGIYPTDSGLPSVGLLDLTLEHPDPELLSRTLDVLQVCGPAVSLGPSPRIVATLGTPNGEVVLG